MGGAEAIDVMILGAHDRWAGRLNFDAAAILLNCGVSQGLAPRKRAFMQDALLAELNGRRHL
jgi:hypothetical protein